MYTYTLNRFRSRITLKNCDANILHFFFRPNIGQPQCIVIHEIYEDNDARDHFEQELERALEVQANMIVIEPSRLGDETARWITVGNCLHKTSVVSAVVSLVCIYSKPEKEHVILPFGFLSVICAGIYAISWQFDPCCKYQVEHNISKLDKVPLHNLTSNTPVVLVRKNDNARKFLHNLLAAVAGGYCAWTIYSWLKK